MKRMSVVLLLLISAHTALAQESAALADDPDDWHLRLDAIQTANAESAGPALTAPLRVCAGTACSHQSDVALNTSEAGQITDLFTPAADDAQAERDRIARAVALFETFVGARNGTWADAPGNRHAEHDEPDQLDCVSETANTRTYLDRLARAGLLAHHVPGRVVVRYTLFLPHMAYSVFDDLDREFVVDSWVGAGGEEPEIQPYADWRSEWAV